MDMTFITPFIDATPFHTDNEEFTIEVRFDDFGGTCFKIFLFFEKEQGANS